jgi:four helix bundle protein
VRSGAREAREPPTSDVPRAGGRKGIHSHAHRLSVALEVITQLRPIVDKVKQHDAHLADQLRRAATNTVANLAEGQRRVAGNKRRAYENAHGEAREMLGCLDCALAWGYVVDDALVRVTLDRLLALCWRLSH